MSKRSGMSRWEDLKRWFIDIGRYRWILHCFDMEPWRNSPCPQCGIAFTEEPRNSFMGTNLHSECFSPYMDQWCIDHPNGDDDWPEADPSYDLSWEEMTERDM